MDPTDLETEHFLGVLRQSPVISSILERWSDVDLPNCWLVAGALAQTVWNDALGLAPHHGISDIDIVYFDEFDLTERSEACNSKRINKLFADILVSTDVKNEARVHLWYEEKFGYSISPYVSVEDAISTFPTTATAVGVRSDKGLLSVYAPFGLSDLLGLVVRANKRQITRQIYQAKVTRWLAAWPNLQVCSWDVDPM